MSTSMANCLARLKIITLRKNLIIKQNISISIQTKIINIHIKFSLVTPYNTNKLFQIRS